MPNKIRGQIKKGRPNKGGCQAISQYKIKIKYIKKTKPNTKYKPFLTLNQNPKSKKKYNQSKEKDLKTKTKNMKTIKKRNIFVSLDDFLSHSYYSYYSLECG